MGGLDPAKLLVILVLALVLLGPERLPRAARQAGALWRDFSKFRERIEEEVRGALPDVDLPSIPVIPRGGVAGYLTGMMTSSERPTAEVSGEDATVATAPGRAPSGESAWQSSGGNLEQGSGPATPNGVPAGWHSRGAEAPGYASGALLSPLPAGAPEAVLRAEVRLDLDDPSWN